MDVRLVGLDKKKLDLAKRLIADRDFGTIRQSVFLPRDASFADPRVHKPGAEDH